MTVASPVRALARELRPDVPALGQRLARQVRDQDPAYVVPEPELLRACTENLAAILDALVQHGEVTAEVLRTPRDTGRRRAEQGVPVESLLRAFRLAGQMVWEALADQVRHQGPEQWARLLDEASAVWSVIDAFSNAVAVAYRDAELELTRRDDQRRTALVEALISGRGVERPVALEAELLLLPGPARYAVVVADAELDGPSGLSRLTALLPARSAVAVGLRPGREVAVVALPRGTDGPLQPLVARLVARAGVGPDVQALGELATSYRLAELALRSGAGVADVGAVVPAALLLSDPDLARVLVERLGAGLLQARPEDRAVLLETASTWLDCGGSATLASARLFCHRNTVDNRLRRLEQLCGRTLSDPGDLVEVALLVRALTLFPELLPDEQA